MFFIPFARNWMEIDSQENNAQIQPVWQSNAQQQNLAQCGTQWNRAVTPFIQASAVNQALQTLSLGNNQQALGTHSGNARNNPTAHQAKR